ncbi:MAG: M3 family metallopeptidase [Leptospiraceae bacterium]|nr:M3 family metallopeptidase [Leptospiraceae bacterium]
MSISSSANNPLLERDSLPRFDAIRPEHVADAVSATLASCEERLQQLESNPPTDWNLIEGLNAIEYELSRTWGPVSHFMGVQNSPELRSEYEKMQEPIVAFSLRMSQSKTIFAAVESLGARASVLQLSAAQRRAIELRLRDARHSGIALPPAEQELYNQKAQELSQLGTSFANHVLDATMGFGIDLHQKEAVAGLPKSWLSQAAQKWQQAHPDVQSPADPAEGPWRLGLDIPSFLPFMQHAERRDLREQVYRAYVSRASSGPNDNSAIILKTLQLRRDMANLLGFDNYAELSIDSKMAASPAAVERLHNDLLEAALPAARQEHTTLQDFARQAGFPDQLAHWDIAYWAERQRESLYDYSEEDLRPYFPMDRVLSGLFQLAADLFQIQITRAKTEPGTWHPDVSYYLIADRNSGQPLASFFLDPFSRPENKRGGAWMDVCINRWQRSASDLELPVAYLVCNGTPPDSDRPSLMTFQEVETLFHEFGHGLQHMLSQVGEFDVAGINGVEWDAVELPSQFMENWCYHQKTLLGLSGHYESGAELPLELFHKIKAARNYRSATALLRQLRFGMLDMELHSNFDPDSGVDALFAAQEKVDRLTSFLEPLAEDRFLCSFQHIFAGGYAAGYYSYKWAEVLSADAFAAFEEAGLENTTELEQVGLRFRRSILALGGSQHPMAVFRMFRGRDPDIQALLRHSGLAA